MPLKDLACTLDFHLEDPEFDELKGLILDFSKKGDSELVDLEKLVLMNEVITCIPQIIRKNRNVSSEMS